MPAPMYLRIVVYLLVASIVCPSVLLRTLDAQSFSVDTPGPTPLPTVAPEAVRKAYMNCLLEVDRTAASLSTNQKAREEEARTQLAFCENRKKDCAAKKDGAECRTFVEEFLSE